MNLRLLSIPARRVGPAFENGLPLSRLPRRAEMAGGLIDFSCAVCAPAQIEKTTRGRKKLIFLQIPLAVIMQNAP
jgi:hypothetical protein